MARCLPMALLGFAAVLVVITSPSFCGRGSPRLQTPVVRVPWRVGFSAGAKSTGDVLEATSVDVLEPEILAEVAGVDGMASAPIAAPPASVSVGDALKAVGLKAKPPPVAEPKTVVAAPRPAAEKATTHAEKPQMYDDTPMAVPAPPSPQKPDYPTYLAAKQVEQWRAELPAWASQAVMGAAALVLAVGLTLSAFSSGTKAPQKALAPVRPAAVVVTVPRTADKPQVANRVQVPSRPAPPVEVRASAPRDFTWAREMSGVAASGLRATADWLPQAERGLEAQAPAIERDLRTLTSGDTDEAVGVLGRALAAGGEAVARTGLHAVAFGLSVAADAMPAAGQALHSAVESGLPAFQGATHAAADATRSLAAKAASMQLLPASAPELARQAYAQAPALLTGAASGLDILADAAPDVQRGLTYGAEKAMPVVQAAFRATSAITEDAAGVQIALPEASQVDAALHAVGVDRERLAAQAAEAAREALAKATAKLPSMAPAAAAQR